MNIDQLSDGIQDKFAKRRIVFGHEPEQTFADEITSVTLDSICILDMSQTTLADDKEAIT